MLEIIYSAMIYFVVFSSSSCLFWVGQKLYAYGRRTYIQRKAVFLLAVLIPCLLAGFRANSVGIDVEVYIVPNMRTANSLWSRSFADCCTALNMAPEYLYMLLVYLCSRVTTDEGLLLFWIQFFTIAPIALAAIQMRKILSIPLVMATYLFFFYNNTLNMMRQSISCAFILLGAVYFLKKYRFDVKTVACFLSACLFHKSGIIGVIGACTLCYVPTLKLKRWVYAVIYGCIVLIPVIATPIFELLNSYGWLSERYVSYADIFLYRTGRQDWFFDSPFTPRFILTTLCLLARLIIPCLYLRHHRYADDLQITTVRSAAICGTLIYLIVQFAMRTIYGNRLSVFFDFFFILLVPYAAQTQGKRRGNRRFVLWAMIIVYWILWVLVLGWSGESHIYAFRF